MSVGKQHWLAESPPVPSKSKKGIFSNAAVAVDSVPCAKVSAPVPSRSEKGICSNAAVAVDSVPCSKVSAAVTEDFVSCAKVSVL